MTIAHLEHDKRLLTARHEFDGVCLRHVFKFDAVHAEDNVAAKQWASVSCSHQPVDERFVSRADPVKYPKRLLP